MTKLQTKLIAEGYCDERGAAFCATATKLPGGEYGLVLLCVKGNELSLYDIDMRNNVGNQLYHVALNQVENLKIRCNILSQVLKFSHEGNVYAFTNFLGVKPALEVIKEEAAK